MSEWADIIAAAAERVAAVAGEMEEHPGCLGTLPERLAEIARALQALAPTCRIPASCECPAWEPDVGWMPRWWAWTHSLAMAILIQDVRAR